MDRVNDSSQASQSYSQAQKPTSPAMSETPVQTDDALQNRLQENRTESLNSDPKPLPLTPEQRARQEKARNDFFEENDAKKPSNQLAQKKSKRPTSPPPPPPSKTTRGTQTLKRKAPQPPKAQATQGTQTDTSLQKRTSSTQTPKPSPKKYPAPQPPKAQATQGTQTLKRKAPQPPKAQATQGTQTDTSLQKRTSSTQTPKPSPKKYPAPQPPKAQTTHGTQTLKRKAPQPPKAHVPSAPQGQSRLDGTGSAFKRGGQKMWQGTKSAGKTAGRGLKTGGAFVAKKTWQGAKLAGKGLAKGAGKAAQLAGKTALAVGKAGAQAGAAGAKALASVAGKGAKALGHGAQSGLSKLKSTIKNRRLKKEEAKAARNAEGLKKSAETQTKQHAPIAKEIATQTEKAHLPTLAIQEPPHDTPSVGTDWTQSIIAGTTALSAAYVAGKAVVSSHSNTSKDEKHPEKEQSSPKTDQGSAKKTSDPTETKKSHASPAKNKKEIS